MKIFLIGSNGLVGSAFARYFKKNDISYTPVMRKDMGRIVGQKCDLMIICIGNANKSKANADPLFDFSESVSAVSHYIHSINAQRVIHISTVDIYSEPSNFAGTKEKTVPNMAKLHTYGFHKYMAETIVRRYAKHWHILRLPGLVGPGLAKNPIFDHFSPHKKLFLDPESRLNFIHTDFIADAAMKLLLEVEENAILNVASSDSIRIGDLSTVTGLPNEYWAHAIGNIQNYNINIELLASYMDVPSSSDCILRYKEDLSSQ